MTVVIPVGYAECAINIMDSATGRFSAVTFGIQADDLSIITNFNAALGAYFPDAAQDMHTDCVAESFTLSFGPGSIPGAGSITVPLDDAIPGAQAGERMTPQVAYLARKATASLGRGTQGRWFLPGVKESMVNGSGTVDAGFLTDMNNHLQSFFEGMATTGIPGGPWPLQLLTTNNGPLPIVAMAYESKVATQRRRLVRS